ncbi:hypothetical protein OIF83_10980 [Neisseria meningitidis]|nr:hypothetical protein [Neisseria meningitidis]
MIGHQHPCQNFKRIPFAHRHYRLPQSQTHRIIGQNLLPFIGYNRKKVSAAIAVKTTVFHSIMLGMIL